MITRLLVDLGASDCLEGRFTQRISLPMTRSEAARGGPWVTPEHRRSPPVLARMWHGHDTSAGSATPALASSSRNQVAVWTCLGYGLPDLGATVC
jgi:hypothetical protein